MGVSPAPMPKPEPGREPRKLTLPAAYTSLDAIPKNYRIKLKELGYISVEQVIAVVRQNPAGFKRYFQTDVSKFLAAVPHKEGLAAKLPAKVALAVYHLGAPLKEPCLSRMPEHDLPAAALMPAKAAPPPSAGLAGTPPSPPLQPPTGADVDLSPLMPAVRNQGDRGTCVAHATCALLEYYYGHNGPMPNPQDFSEQFQYWNCKQHDGIPTEEGTFLSVSVPLLFTDGCCKEPTWTYVPTVIPGNESQDPPPPAALQEAPRYKISKFNQLNARAVADIKRELAQGRPVAITVPVFDYCWFNGETRVTGDITLPFPGDTTNEGHAVCLVGYEDLLGEENLGGGRFLVRNSWNALWGVNNVLEAGYGTIPYSYITTYGDEAYTVE